MEFRIYFFSRPIGTYQCVCVQCVEYFRSAYMESTEQNVLVTHFHDVLLALNKLTFSHGEVQAKSIGLALAKLTALIRRTQERVMSIYDNFRTQIKISYSLFIEEIVCGEKNLEISANGREKLSETFYRLVKVFCDNDQKSSLFSQSIKITRITQKLKYMHTHVCVYKDTHMHK